MRHKSNLLNIVCIVVTMLFIFQENWFPGWSSTIAPWVLFASVFIIGIPHGAIDHIIATHVYNLRQTTRSFISFYGSYLFAMLLIAIIWLISPEAGLIFFLLISVYHFGQADIHSFTEETSIFHRLFHYSRGIYIVGLIIFPHPEITYPVIETAIQRPENWLSEWIPVASSISFILIGQYVCFMILFALRSDRKSQFVSILIDSVIIGVLFYFTHPVIAFSVYFALWHSAGHVQEMIDYFKYEGEEVQLFDFYKMAMPFTLLSAVGLVAIYALFDVFTEMDKMIPLLFIFISVLTLPHMIIADRMFTLEKSLQAKNKNG